MPHIRVAENAPKNDPLSQVLSLMPDAMDAHAKLRDALTASDGPLSTEQRELVAIVVAQSKGCEESTRYHADALCSRLHDRFWVEKIIENPRGADLKPHNRALVDYVLKLLEEPHSMSRLDVELMHAAGFSDEQVLAATLLTSYYCATTLIVMSLGVELGSPGPR